MHVLNVLHLALALHLEKFLGRHIFGSFWLPYNLGHKTIIKNK